MNRLGIVIMTFAATFLPLTAAPRIALVRVKDIYSGLPSTETLQKQVKTERDQIMKGQRADDLRKIIDELKALQARLSDKENPLDEASSKKVARNYEIKRQEAQTLQKEFEVFRSEQEKQINRRMVSAMRASLDKIAEISRKVAKEQGFDMVIDGSGGTNTGVPFVLYQKSSPDITEDVIAALKDAMPAGTEAKPPQGADENKSAKPGKPNTPTPTR